MLARRSERACLREIVRSWRSDPDDGARICLTLYLPFNTTVA
jgi:hypothetical protein